MAHSDSVHKSYSDFLLPDHAATTNFENYTKSDELCDVAVDSLTERIGTCDTLILMIFLNYPILVIACLFFTLASDFFTQILKARKLSHIYPFATRY